MLVPAGILAMILTSALVPDVAMQPVTEENPDEDTVSAGAAGAGRRRRRCGIPDCSTR